MENLEKVVRQTFNEQCPNLPAVWRTKALVVMMDTAKKTFVKPAEMPALMRGLCEMFNLGFEAKEDGWQDLVEQLSER